MIIGAVRYKLSNFWKGWSSYLQQWEILKVFFQFCYSAWTLLDLLERTSMSKGDRGRGLHDIGRFQERLNKNDWTRSSRQSENDNPYINVFITNRRKRSRCNKTSFGLILKFIHPPKLLKTGLLIHVSLKMECKKLLAFFFFSTSLYPSSISFQFFFFAFSIFLTP